MLWYSCAKYRLNRSSYWKMIQTRTCDSCMNRINVRKMQWSCSMTLSSGVSMSRDKLLFVAGLVINPLPWRGWSPSTGEYTFASKKIRCIQPAFEIANMRCKGSQHSRAWSFVSIWLRVTMGKKQWNKSFTSWCPYYSHIRRPLPSLGLGGAAPGITVGVQPWLFVPALPAPQQPVKRSTSLQPAKAIGSIQPKLARPRQHQPVAFEGGPRPRGLFWLYIDTVSKLLCGTFWPPSITLKKLKASKSLKLPHLC